MIKDNNWIRVEDSLPEPFTRNIQKFQGILAYVKDPESVYGGYLQVLFYGDFEFYDSYDAFPKEADDDGMVKRFGWYYERDSEGEYDYLTFDMNGKVTHWMPLPEVPNDSKRID